MDMGLALWLILNFIFCILYFWNFGFVFFLYIILYFWNFGFVFFCILYFWEIAFVFIVYLFCIYSLIILYFYKKYKINTNKYTMFVFVFVFFHYFQKCTLYFCIFFVFFHSFTDCTLSLCIFRSLDMPSKNKTANPPMHGCIFLYFGFVFCILMITGSTVCSQRLTTQHLYVFDCFCFMLRRVLIIPI